VEVVASLSQGRTAAAQCGLFTHKSVPVIFEPPCTFPQSFNPQASHNMDDGNLAPTECDTQIKYLKSNICTTTTIRIVYPLQCFCFSDTYHDVTTITYQPICPYMPPLNQKE